MLLQVEKGGLCGQTDMLLVLSLPLSSCGQGQVVFIHCYDEGNNSGDLTGMV